MSRGAVNLEILKLYIARTALIDATNYKYAQTRRKRTFNWYTEQVIVKLYNYNNERC